MMNHIKILIFLIIISTLSFSSNQLTSQEKLNLKYLLTKKFLEEDIASYQSEILTGNDLIEILTEGIIIDDILKKGYSFTDVTLETQPDNGYSSLDEMLDFVIEEYQKYSYIYEEEGNYKTTILVPNSYKYRKQLDNYKFRILNNQMKLMNWIINKKFDDLNVYTSSAGRDLVEAIYVSTELNYGKLRSDIFMKNLNDPDYLENRNNQGLLNSSLDLEVHMIFDNEDETKGIITFTNSLISLPVNFELDYKNDLFYLENNLDTLIFNTGYFGYRYIVKNLLDNILNFKCNFLGIDIKPIYYDNNNIEYGVTSNIILPFINYDSLIFKDE